MVGISPFNGKVGRFVSDRSGEEGIYWDVSDAMIESINVVSASLNDDNTYDAIRLKKSVRGSKFTAWTKGSDQATAKPRYVVNADVSGVMIDQVSLEQGKTANIRIGGNYSQIAGQSYSLDAAATAHVIIGDSSSFNKLNLTLISAQDGEVGVLIGSASLLADNNHITTRAVQ